MGSIFNVGEQMARPGVYRRYVNQSVGNIAGANDGIVAVVIQSNWGPLGAVTTHEGTPSVDATYGTGGANGTVEVASLALDAGASAVRVTRVGTGGTKGTLTLDGNSSTEAVTITAKYEGNRAFTVTVRDSIGDNSLQELIVYDGTTAIETIKFAKGATVAQNCVTAVNSNSNYFTASKIADVATLTNVTQEAVTPGTNPTVTNEAYATALALFESYKFNIAIVDTNATAVHLLLQAFISRIYNNGSLPMGCVGEPTSVAFATRCTNASSYNDEKMIYVGGAFKDFENNDVEGYKAAAVVAGLVASTPSNESIVHTILSGASETKEKLTDSQCTTAINSGMLLFSDNGDGGVWVDSAVNTLVNPAQNQDDGWKKIKRVKVRFEMFDRIDRTLAPVVGKITNDKNGIANVEQLGNTVLAAMAAESKILPGGTVKEDLNNPHSGDSAWFLISVDDIDTLEKIYLTYQLRFGSN